jgi:hypothetical protein
LDNGASDQRFCCEVGRFVATPPQQARCSAATPPSLRDPSRFLAIAIVILIAIDDADDADGDWDRQHTRKRGRRAAAP